jgi:hypothetical protein
MCSLELANPMPVSKNLFSSSERLENLAKCIYDDSESEPPSPVSEKTFYNEEVKEIKTEIKTENKLIVISAGYSSGKFSEIKIHNDYTNQSDILLEKNVSKRGLNILLLTQKKYIINLDFYFNNTRMLRNKQLFHFIQTMPSNIIFALTISDDASGIYNGIKTFLATVVGCKMIRQVEYRNSWCAIIYKKSPNTFEVLGESYNPHGIAQTEVDITHYKNYVNAKKNENDNDEIIVLKKNPLEHSTNDSEKEFIKQEINIIKTQLKEILTILKEGLKE